MKKLKFLIILFMLLVVGFILYSYFKSVNIPILEPKGLIATEERNLIIFALLLSLIVVVPVFFLLFFFAYRYRETNPKKVKYSPDLKTNKLVEFIWWTVPSVIILILSIVTWQSSHALDPYKPILSRTPGIEIEVVALDWRWLFIYPKYDVASTNYMVIPNNVPINLRLTSDAPMNSFWVPALAGQIYAMPGMSTQLHLIANSFGNYYGSSANISGQGFSKMHFIVHSNSTQSFNLWIKNLKNAKNKLSLPVYNKLSQPSLNSSIIYYSKVDPNLYTDIIMKYMAPIIKTKNYPKAKYNNMNSMGSMNS